MMTWTDDLAQRGGASFAEQPFQELDGALLSRLAYLPFERTATAQRTEPLRLPEAAALLLQTPEALAHVTQPEDLHLLRLLAESVRFCSALLLDAVGQTDEATQFSALTLQIAPQTLCIAFRGTDDTLIGWKEDFSMSFLCPVPAQELAADYLRQVAAQRSGDLLLCGHSKGGNLAVYAAASCASSVQSRIRAVYNYDGPGFPESILRQAGYQTVCGRVQTFVPQSSVIGMLLGHEEQYTVVHSTRMGIFQHDLYSWDIADGHFVCLESVNQHSRFIDTTLKAWLAADARRARALHRRGVLSAGADQRRDAARAERALVFQFQNHPARLEKPRRADAPRRHAGAASASAEHLDRPFADRQPQPERKRNRKELETWNGQFVKKHYSPPHPSARPSRRWRCRRCSARSSP